MGAYLMNAIRMRDGIPNEQGLAKVKRSVEAFGGRWHSPGEAQWSEGDRTNALILVEFADMTQAQTWYNSADYRNVSRVYVDNAIDLALADGLSPDFTMAGFAQM
jgi:uncharacterized protein (DUF1330 family)